MAYGAARCDVGEPMCILFVTLTRAAYQRVGEFRAQSLANTAWAFVKVVHSDAVLFAALARASEQLTFTFAPQKPASATLAFPTAGQSAV